MAVKLNLLFLLFLAMAFVCNVEAKCLNADGEAAIVNGDVPSAKMEAIARAKWAAVEQAMGVQVKAQSVVQNMALVDDAVSSQVNGYVSKYTLLGVSQNNQAVSVRINACVDPAKAQQALSSLALNSSVAVFIPARKPKVTREEEEIRRSPYLKSQKHTLETTDEHDEANILSETLVGMLAEQGITVVDVAPTRALDAAQIETAMRSGNYMSLRSAMYQSLSNLLLIGKIDYTISSRKGQEVSDGLVTPFNHVTVRLSYRLVTKDPSGRTIILAAGAEAGKGLANNVEDAAAEGLKDLAETFGPVVLEKISDYLKGASRKVTVKIAGITDLSRSLEVKDALQGLAWVKDVEPKGLNQFLVSYQENPIYLANSISQKGIRVKTFSPVTITAEYPEQGSDEK